VGKEEIHLVPIKFQTVCEEARCETILVVVLKNPGKIIGYEVPIEQGLPAEKHYKRTHAALVAMCEIGICHLSGSWQIHINLISKVFQMTEAAFTIDITSCADI
jgi:hypothetical protein